VSYARHAVDGERKKIAEAIVGASRFSIGFATHHLQERLYAAMKTTGLFSPGPATALGRIPFQAATEGGRGPRDTHRNGLIAA
jgi:hypothetical protein